MARWDDFVGDADIRGEDAGLLQAECSFFATYVATDGTYQVLLCLRRVFTADKSVRTLDGFN